MARDSFLSIRNMLCVKSLVIALALTGFVWSAGPHAQVQPDYDELSYTADAGPAQSPDASDEARARSIPFSPAEPDDAGAATPSADAATEISTDGICAALDRSAADNEVPLDYFTRLIWQESRFNPRAVSHAGAQGIAQFMPGTARIRGLADPFDPRQAIPKSAELLRDLARQFGNFGLAAAAYNAGPGRVVDWLTGRKALPKETQAYVRIITGRPAEDWTAAEPAGSEVALRALPPCAQLASLARLEDQARRAAPVAKAPVGGSRSPGHAMIALRSVQQRRATQAKAQQRLAHAPRIADAHKPRIADARGPRIADARASRVADAYDTRLGGRNRLVHMAAIHTRGPRPKRVAHAL